MSVSDWFQRFEGNIRVPNGGLIALRTQRITARLNRAFWNTESETAHRFYAGSYGRNTAIKGVSDIDVVFELPWATYTQYNNYLGNGQSALLQAVRAALALSYPNTTVAADGQIVKVQLGDGMLYEIVPAFPHTDGTHTYADSNLGGRWRTMDPKSELTAIRGRNLICNGNLVPLARMMRAWRRTSGVAIKGMLIDTLMYQFLLTNKYNDKSYLYCDFLSRDFFKFLADQNPLQTYWLTPGAGRQIPGAGFQYPAKQAYNVTLQAIEHEQNKRHWSAQIAWRSIYGPEF